MEIISYFYIAAGLFFLWCWGRVFIKTDPFTSLLAGILIAGGILAVTARFIPLYSRELVGLMAGIGIIVLVVDRHKNQLHFEWDKLLLPTMVVVAIYFRYMHFQNWPYDAEDIIHDSPALEMLNADYFGNLRLFYYYPYEMTASHLMHPAALAAIAFLTPHLSLIITKEIAYILVVLFFSNIIVRLFRICQMKWPYYILTLICCFGIFGLEIGFQVTFTSLLYVLVLFHLLLLFFQKGFYHRELLFFSIMLIATRASIFYIGGILAFYLWIRYKEYRFKPLTIFASVIVAANMFTWTIITPPVDVDASFWIVNPFNLIEGLKGLFHLYPWIASDNVLTLLIPELWSEDSFFAKRHVGGGSLSDIILYLPQVIAVTFYLLYVIIKYYTVFFTAHYYLKRKIQIDAFFVYMTVSLIGLLIVRNGSNIGHQIHTFWTASIVSFVYLLMVVSKEKKILLVLVPVGIFYWYNYNPTLIPNWKSTPSPPQATFNSHQWPTGSDGFYKPLSDEILSRRMELKAMMTGLRLHAKDVLAIVPAQTQRFVLTDKPRFNVTISAVDRLKNEGLPENILKKLAPKKAVNISSGYFVAGKENFVKLLNILIGIENTKQYQSQIMQYTLR